MEGTECSAENWRKLLSSNRYCRVLASEFEASLIAWASARGYHDCIFVMLTGMHMVRVPSSPGEGPVPFVIVGESMSLYEHYDF